MNAPWTLAALFNLDTNPGETRHFHTEQPKIVKLTTLLDKSKAAGRSSSKL